MTYPAGEIRILALIQGLTKFNTDNTSRADWQILYSGDSRWYAIIKPGDAVPELVTMNRYHYHYTTIIEVWNFFDPKGSETENVNTLETRVQEIKDGLAPYRKTNDTGDTVIHAEIGTMPLPQEIMNQDGGLEWLMQEVTLEWTEEQAPTFAE